MQRWIGPGIAVFTLAGCVDEPAQSPDADVTTSSADSTGLAPSDDTTALGSSSSGDEVAASSSTGDVGSEGTSGGDTGAGSSSGDGDSGSTGGGESTGDVPGVCGDGIVDVGEACDDGNAVAGDGCEDDCSFSDGVAEVAAGGSHTCARFHDGAVRCWGRNQDGQLGDPMFGGLPASPAAATMPDIDLGGFAVDVDAGDAHSCAVLQGGALRCWGRNDEGQLGYGFAGALLMYPSPADLGDVPMGGETVVEVAAGLAHTCVRLDTGAVRCWGVGASTTVLGYGVPVPVLDPATAGDVPLGGVAVQISAGPLHTCAVLDDATVRCWGHGGNGRLGYGNTNDIGDDETPADAGPVDVGGAVAEVTTGSFHTCARLVGGGLRCWGGNVMGQLGYGHTDTIGDDEPPSAAGDVAVAGPTVAVAAGALHTCAVLAGGDVRCWGLAAMGRLGYANAITIGDDETPDTVGPVDIGGPVAGIAMGLDHACARLDDGALRCWGASSFHQLGFGGTLGNLGDDETPSTAGDLPF